MKSLRVDKSYYFNCNHCSLNITNKIIIICACCKDLVLCSNCFSHGVELLKHKKTHEYQIVVCDQQSVFQEGWSVEEESRLFKAIDKRGFQNWKGISILVGSKSESECKLHYEELFLNSPNYDNLKPKLLPPHKNINKHKRERKNRKRMQKKRSQNLYPIFSSSDDELIWDPQEESEFNISTHKKKTTISEKLGYIPKRNEFGHEHNNDYEEILDQMGIIDNLIDWDLKNKVLKGYNQKLEEREKKKQFVVSMGLIHPLRSDPQNKEPQKQIGKNKKLTHNIETNTLQNRYNLRKRKRSRPLIKQKTHTKNSKKRRQYQKKMRVFAKCFDKRSDYERSCDSLYQEFKLQSEIKLLLQLQKNINTTPQSQISMKPNKRNSTRKLVEMNKPESFNTNSKSLDNNKQIQDKMELVETGHSPSNDIIPPIVIREEQILFEKN
ncbi:transcriptional adapter 2-alpha [Anaeramoeba flamelloides]|uniref:Transcriptional adapter 2-alpha n=1 Tax=Anaeramoeba flamelloides TaxID=1746091 RepID=A0AAV7YQ41_9EUKA|nr:transcriptional adapter 2-alpha [Anaeramoeba flamelloides]